MPLALELQPHAAPGGAVNHESVAIRLRLMTQQDADEPQSALGNLVLRVHVETAGADVFRTRDPRNAFAGKENIHDQPRAIVIAPLILRIKASLVVVSQGVSPPQRLYSFSVTF